MKNPKYTILQSVKFFFFYSVCKIKFSLQTEKIYNKANIYFYNSANNYDTYFINKYLRYGIIHSESSFYLLWHSNKQTPVCLSCLLLCLFMYVYYFIFIICYFIFIHICLFMWCIYVLFHTDTPHLKCIFFVLVLLALLLFIYFIFWS